jgi:hypothetical protein
MTKTTFFLAGALLAGCGTSEAGESTTEATAGGEETAPAQTSDATAQRDDFAERFEAAARAENPEAFAGGAAPGTRAALLEMQAVVIEAYPAPFEQTFATLTSRYGEPASSAENMFKWFGREGDRCYYFFVTRPPEGTAAAGVAEGEPGDCP